MTPVEKVQSLIEGLRSSGDSGRQWIGCCPAHDDATQSFALGQADNGSALVKCYKGCTTEEICAAIGIEVRDLYVIPEAENPGVTLGKLAFHKRLSVGFLKSLGLRQISGRNAIEIPYLDLNGDTLYVRTRESLRAKDGTRQPKGVKLRPYGLWKLQEFAAEGQTNLTLVEGESDCWRLWFHGFAALGLPGASTAKTLRAEDVADFASLTLWQEPDDGGADFVRDIVNRLAEIGYPGIVRVHAATRDAKDPADIGAYLDAKFPDRFREILAAATAPNVREKGVSPADGTVPPCVADAAFDKSPYPWGRHPFTEQGNARRLVQLGGENLLYIEPWDRWYVWDGVRWEHDTTLAVERLATRAVHGVWWEAQQAPSLTAKDVAESWWEKSQSAGRQATMIELARESVAGRWQDFDVRHDLFNAANGTIDLRTGELVEPDRDHRMTLRSPVRYDPDAECPVWERTLDRLFARDPQNPNPNPNTDVVEFVHRLFGMCLTGRTQPAILPIFFGAGANGKSLVIKVVSNVVGRDYVMSASDGFLIERGKTAERHPTEQADMFGKRIVFSVETNDGEKLNAGMVKKLTGDDRITARRMREDMWTFDATHKLILCTNHKPHVNADDDAAWRRLALVQFGCVFWNPDKLGESGQDHLKQDHSLLSKLMAESEGILAWLVRGAMRFIEDGLRIPECVSRETDAYRGEEDTVLQYLNHRTTKSSDGRVSKGDLYDDYREWADAEGFRPISKRKFGASMPARGYGESRDGQDRYWTRLILNKSDELSREFDT